jgi:hypothetical protein
VVGAEVYELSQHRIQQAAPRIAAAVQATGAQAVFTTATANADLPIVASALPAAGLSPETARLVGLTRWDAAPQLLALPGSRAGSSPSRSGPTQQFESRYQAAYGRAPHPLARAGLRRHRGHRGAGARGRRAGAVARLAHPGPGLPGNGGHLPPSADGHQPSAALAVATVRNIEVVILDPAPRAASPAAGF